MTVAFLQQDAWTPRLFDFSNILLSGRTSCVNSAGLTSGWVQNKCDTFTIFNNQPEKITAQSKDLRDERPLIYPARVLVPAAATAAKLFWKKSALFTGGRTQQATQLSGKEMRTVEKVGEGQLPSSTDADCTVRGALKTAQIGGDAAAKVFKLLTVLWMQYTYFIYIYISRFTYTHAHV